MSGNPLPKRSKSRGSTVVEVLMAISVLAVGASGIIALQKTTVVANRDAKNLEVANEIARTWIERLRADAMLWNHPSAYSSLSDLDTDTVWLANRVVQPSATAAWFRPVVAAQQIYGVHTSFGTDDTTSQLNGPFCVNLRLKYLREQPDQGMIRAEVRVYWLRSGLEASRATAADEVPTPLCGAAPNAPPIDETRNDVYHLVYLTTALVKNSY